jgi:hypothetical protein
MCDAHAPQVKKYFNFLVHKDLQQKNKVILVLHNDFSTLYIEFSTKW